MRGEGIGAHLGHASRPDPSFVDVEGIEVVHQVVSQLVGEREPLTARRLAAAHQDQRASPTLTQRPSTASGSGEKSTSSRNRSSSTSGKGPSGPSPSRSAWRTCPASRLPWSTAGPGRPHPAAPPPVLGRAAPSGGDGPRTESSSSSSRISASARRGPGPRRPVTEMAEPRRDRQHGTLPGAEQVEDRDAEDLGQLGQLQRADRPYTRLDPRHRRLGQPDPLGQLPLRPALPAASVGDPLTEFVLADSLHLWIT